MRVGFALKKEKARKHVREELLEAARERGIEIVVIDETRSLEEQGPFDVILQKIRKPEFERELEDYQARHPDVHLCDPPSATLQLRNRKSMLSVMPKEGFDIHGYKCTVPKHVVLEEGIDFKAAQERVRGLRYPFLAKSLWADGRAGSHDIAVVWSSEGLQRLCNGSEGSEEDMSEIDSRRINGEERAFSRNGEEPAGVGPNGVARGSKLPVLLEQYVDHGECLFKVYVLGDEQLIVTRPSLHLDLSSDGVESPPAPLQSVSRVSAYPSSRSWGNASLAPPDHGVPTPPEQVWRGIAQRLQERLGLSLFNFDLIVPMAVNSKEQLIHLIDVNYYPGIEKLPDSSSVLVRYMESLMN
jgi:inositol-1,3,4-trisphosphate 5/6-kinase/inositol-tetrakisphosphate 1-kinase